MKIEGFLFAGCAVFFALMDVVYWLWSKDPTGTTALALSVGLAGLVAFYILFTGRRVDPRPEDDKEGEIADAAGEQGFFSPHSWWPFFVALACATMAVGAVIGWWMVIIGAFAIILSAIGFVFEYYRGHFSH